MLTSKSAQTVLVVMRSGAKPYVGFMLDAKGKTVPCNLTPGPHLLPVEKAKQLCRDFPETFSLVEGKALNPPTPESSGSSTSAAPASSTESSIPKESKKGKR